MEGSQIWVSGTVTLEPSTLTSYANWQSSLTILVAYMYIMMSDTIYYMCSEAAGTKVFT